MPLDMLDPSPLGYVEGAGESSSTYPIPAAVLSGRITHFVAIPSDDRPLTSEQLEALFPSARRALFVREIARLARQKAVSEDAA